MNTYDFTLNGEDITEFVAPTGYKVSTKVVTGNNNMTMADGRTFRDIVANLTTVKVPLMPLTDEQVGYLMNLLFTGGNTCEIIFHDANYLPNVSDGYRRMDANYTMSERKYRGEGADGQTYWTGMTLSFEEFGHGFTADPWL